MKYPLFFPLVLISLTLSSCVMIGGTETAICTIDTDCKDTEMCYFKPEGTVGSCVIKTEEAPIVETPVVEQESPVTPTPTPANPQNNTSTTPDNNIPKAEEVSTEELTKELDAFVDDITKGL